MRDPGANRSIEPKKKELRGGVNTLTHGLYFHPEKIGVDYRTQVGRAIKEVMGMLLDHFPPPVPAAAQLLAQRCAFKLVRAASFEAYVLETGRAPSATADTQYLKLCGSIRADIQILHILCKDGLPPKKLQSLSEYLEALRSGKLISVKTEATEPEPQARACGGGGCKEKSHGDAED